jgi:16S rRNA processing protein RimM
VPAYDFPSINVGRHFVPAVTFNRPCHLIKNPISIAKLGRPHGLRGWVLVQSFAHPPEQLFDYAPLYLQTGKTWREINISGHKIQDQKLLLHIEGCDTPEAAKTYTNQLIAIDRSQLSEPKEGEYYWRDLEGLRVVNQADVELGRVDHLINTGANDIFVVKGKKEYFIPHLKQFILSIDLKEKVIIADWEEDF